MRNRIYYYSSNLKKLPKGLFFLIILILLILIPLLISLVLIGGALMLATAIIKSFLPGRKNTIPTKEGEPTIIDITPKKGFLK